MFVKIINNSVIHDELFKIVGLSHHIMNFTTDIIFNECLRCYLLFINFLVTMILFSIVIFSMYTPSA